MIVLQGKQLLLQGFDLLADTFLLLGVAIKVACHLGDVLRREFCGVGGVGFRHDMALSVVRGHGGESRSHVRERMEVGVPPVVAGSPQDTTAAGAAV
ncbi:hypothetical protein HEP87_56630 [Streptomyces sp. S1D4-11]